MNFYRLMPAPMVFGDLGFQVLIGTRLQSALATPVEQPRQQVARLIKPIEIMQRMGDDERVVLIRSAAVWGIHFRRAGSKSGSASARFNLSGSGHFR